MSVCGEKGDIVQQVSENSLSVFVDSVFNMQSLRHNCTPILYIYIYDAQWLSNNFLHVSILAVHLQTSSVIKYMYMNNNNKHDALFIFSLLSYHTSTCFGHISSPLSGGRMCIYEKWYLLYF
jgi:hypothetical protein